MKLLKIRQYIFYSLLTLFLTSSLASCGFQLKQSAALPASFGPVSVEGISKFSSFYKTVRNALRQSSIKIVDSTAASHQLQIQPSRQRKVLSVNSAGKVSEYELIQRVKFQVTSAQGTTLIAPTTLSRSTFYTTSNTEVLGDINEESDIYQRLEEQLVDQVFNRISAAL